VKDKLEKLERRITEDIAKSTTADDLEKLRIGYIGRKGELTAVLKNIKEVSPDERPYVGRKANELKSLIEAKIKEGPAQPKGACKKKTLDVTLPGSHYETGALHPITGTINEICRIFRGLGYRIAEGPEIETEYHNFTALNIPEDHPSREDFHTFFLDLPAERTKKTGRPGRMLLRSQTSTVQIRAMEAIKPPLQIIAPGKVFRPDATDASHSFMFHQVEGLIVDKGIRFSDLKGTLDLFCKKMFGADTKTRFRPHFFPFTEPSAEVDVSCMMCKGAGCRVCGRKGWLEILGAGMVNPKVFEAVGYDPDEWTGFAFGMGVERIAMLKWGITDIRVFFDNDVRFLGQFA